MENETTQPVVQPVGAPVENAAPIGASAPKDARMARGGFRGGARPDRKRSRDDRARSEFDQKILNIRRVTRVASGGRRFSFSVAIALGNHKGSVGIGTGKASDTALAIDKAIKNAKKNMVKVSFTSSASIPHEVRMKYASARIVIMPAKGRGLIAGSAVRDVLELAGAKDVVGKIFSGSKNKLNIARATVRALSAFASAKERVSSEEGEKTTSGEKTA